MEQILEPTLTTTEQHHAATADTPVSPAPDPRLVSAAGVLVAWLMEQLSDPAEDAELLKPDKVLERVS